VPVLEMEAAEGALEGVPFQTPRRVQSLEGAMNDNLNLRSAPFPHLWACRAAPICVSGALGVALIRRTPPCYRRTQPGSGLSSPAPAAVNGAYTIASNFVPSVETETLP